MEKNQIIMNGIILIYVIQRIGELLLSKNNEAWLKQHHQASESYSNESRKMKIFHLSWFVALILESNYRHSFQASFFSLVVYFILALCMVVRIHSMGQLRQFWSIKTFFMKDPIIATGGLYQYIRHPNYLIVIFELFFIPFLFKAYFTMTFFSLINVYILLKRIQAEERTLMMHANYREHFKDKKRFIPYIFILCMISYPIFSKEINVHSFTYSEAKKSENYLKFQSASTKLGFITTDFDGYAKEFKVNYDEKDQTLTKIEVIVPVKFMDTDVNSRDDKMHKEILEAEKFPTLKVSFEGSLRLVNGEQKINMVFKIKDKEITKTVLFYLIQKENRWLITGKAQLSLLEMGLPDPSIVIAKVRDQFDIEFNVFL